MLKDPSRAQEWEALQEEDIINHPRHYKTSSIEPIDVIEAWDLPYHLGNVIKYIARHKHKGTELKDLKKAAWYLNRHITRKE